MLSQKSLIPSSPLPYPPTPPFWPWRNPVLGHIRFACPMGLSFQWWPTRPSFDTYAARTPGYWLVHNVVPPIGLQIPLAPWVLSLAPPLGALCRISILCYIRICFGVYKKFSLGWSIITFNIPVMFISHAENKSWHKLQHILKPNAYTCWELKK